MKRYYYIVWIVLCCFCSCQDMFYREVTFQNSNEPQQLVLYAALRQGFSPYVLVRHTFPADTTSKDEGLVDNAWVHTRVNGVDLPAKQSWEMRSYNTSYDPLHPFDSVEISVVHPDYPTAYVKTVIPAPVTVRDTSWVLQDNYWTAISVDLDAYTGNPDDMIGFECAGTLIAKRKRSPLRDTLHISMLYSADPVFALADNFEQSGYYGGNVKSILYIPASALQQPRRVELIADTRWERQKSDYEEVQVSSMKLAVFSCNRDYFLFDRSCRKYAGYKYMDAPSGVPGKQRTMTDIMDNISYYLGNQEMVQVYSNVEGGLGTVAAISVQLVDLK
ncbi:MAG: DUF4249 family protein [Paludibacteraceae bacterium]|nr:DUF4249 family protein [Paludibacteraceae bacterium]MBO5619788.1 DUF4249 family protein [Paludibacteraceae bacterium]